MLLKNYEEARADFSEAIRRLPNSSAAYALRANARERLGYSLGASADAAKAMELAAAPPASKWYTKDQAPPAPDEIANRSGALIHRIGGAVSPPRVLSQQEPGYTEEARQAKVQGAVVMSLVIDDQGMPRDFKIVSPLGYGLDEKAIEAVQRWRFQPGMKDSKPVSVYSTIEVSFRLL